MTDKALLPVAVRPLPNGATLYHICNASHLTRIECVMRTGSIHEATHAGCGLSHFLEHMLFQGCEHYPGNLASDTIHKLGGECNAYTTFDHTAYYVEVPVEKFADGADVLTSMISKPLFPEDKFISEKQVIAREADMIADRPGHVLVQQLWHGLFPNHPARFPIIGFPDKIAAVTSEDMRNYYRKRYGAMRSHWIVTGSHDTDDIQDILSEKLADFARGDLEEPLLPDLPEQCFAIHSSEYFADPLTRIALGIRAPRAGAPENPALDLLAGILGGSDSSLLPGELLYKKNLALSVDAEFDTLTFGSIMGISAVCPDNNAEKVKRTMEKIISGVCKQGINSAALKREKLQQEQTMYQLLKTSSGMVNMVNTMVINFNTADVQGYLNKLKAVSTDEINATAREYLVPHRFVWAEVRPENKRKKSSGKTAANTNSEVISGKLDNQVKYVLLERNLLPVDSLSAVLPAGPVWENSSNHGISQMMSKLLATGPGNMSEEKFYAYLDKYGMELDVSCGNNTLSIELNYPPRSQKHAQKIFSELLAAPRWEKDVFERIQKNLIEQLNSRLLDPNFAAILRAKREIFADHCGGNSRLESVENLRKLTLEDIKIFYHNAFSPEWVNFGSTFAPGTKNHAAESWKNYFQQISPLLPWSHKKLPKPQPADSDLLNRPQDSPFYSIHVPREQSAVVCAVAGGFAHTEEYYALLIMDAALNGLSSKLFKEVREKRSLAYSTGVFVNCGLVQGIVALHAGVLPENAAEALKCLKNELQRLIDKGLDDEEFEAAKLASLSSLARQMECVDARLLHAQLALFYGDEPEKSLNCSEIIRNMQLDTCNQYLHDVLTRSPAVGVIAGNTTTQNNQQEN